MSEPSCRVVKAASRSVCEPLQLLRVNVNPSQPANTMQPLACNLYKYTVCVMWCNESLVSRMARSCNAPAVPRHLSAKYRIRCQCCQAPASTRHLSHCARADTRCPGDKSLRHHPGRTKRLQAVTIHHLATSPNVAHSRSRCIQGCPKSP